MQIPKIPLIKLVRTILGTDLRDSKAFVDTFYTATGECYPERFRELVSQLCQRFEVDDSGEVTTLRERLACIADLASKE